MSYRGWLVPVTGVVVLIIHGGCTPPAATGGSPLDASLRTPLEEAHVSPSQPYLRAIPGVPDKPDLVTVIPFVDADTVDHGDSNDPYTRVVIPADVDGHRGRFVLDLGSSILCLNRTFFQPNPSGGVDTITEANRLPDHTGPDDPPNTWDSVYVHVRLGTLLDTFDDPTLRPTRTHPVNAVLNHMWGNYTLVNGFGPILGNIGPPVLEPFETIIDYTQRRVILIRLDPGGHRLADVAAYTPAWSTPLIDLDVGTLYNYSAYRGQYFWGIRALLGGMPDSLAFDTGMPTNTLASAVYTKLSSHMKPYYPSAGPAMEALDSVVVAGHAFSAVQFFPHPAGLPDINIFGYPFLHQLGVVGFNHRTHQFILYR